MAHLNGVGLGIVRSQGDIKLLTKIAMMPQVPVKRFSQIAMLLFRRARSSTSEYLKDEDERGLKSLKQWRSSSHRIAFETNGIRVNPRNRGSWDEIYIVNLRGGYLFFSSVGNREE